MEFNFLSSPTTGSQSLMLLVKVSNCFLLPVIQIRYNCSLLSFKFVITVTPARSKGHKVPHSKKECSFRRFFQGIHNIHRGCFFDDIHRQNYIHRAFIDRRQLKDILRHNHHFLVLNLLTFGITTDQKRLPTELAVELVQAIVSTFPVKTFSLPIFSSKQLSFLSCFRASYELGELIIGDSHLPNSLACILGVLTISATQSCSSCSCSKDSKQGCAKASTAVILSSGFFLSILVNRSSASASSRLYSSPSKVMLAALFCARTQLQVLPGKALTPKRKIWKMSPKLKTSQMGSYLVFISLMLMTSGATYPGVPQRTNRYSSASANSASPKSAITHSQLPSRLKSIFSGFKSRCIILLPCISLSPSRMECMTAFVYRDLNLYLALILSQSWPPQSSSTAMYSEFQDSKTSCSFMQFFWFSTRIIYISLIRHSLPLSSLYAASLEKALIAMLLPSSNFYARQTDAKFPFPIFFLGLNCS